MQSSDKFNPFNRLLSVLALLASALYFTGWIYRWAYYGFFHVEVTTLNLSFESFYLAAFQVLFGSLFILLKNTFIFSIAGLIGLAALSLKRKIINLVFRRFSSQSLVSTKTLQFFTEFLDEILIVFLVLCVLFWSARLQANNDAWKDAVNETSRLPVVTVAFSSKDFALGRDVNDPFINPSGVRLIGDAEMYNQLLGKELSVFSDSTDSRVWRLLVDRDGYFYVFPSLPRKDPSLNFPVLVVYESRSQFVILSPVGAK